MSRILVLGAGLVARPLVTYLTEFDDLQLTVASRTLSKAEELIRDRPRARALRVDVHDWNELARLVGKSDVVVSLLPAEEHVAVARLCLEYRKHLATTSYIGPEMRALDGPANRAGLTFLNECGLDPGIDHMSAMRVIDAARDGAGTVVSFRSYCGGLPAPEANDNPLGYKFSWAPRSVLLAATQPARFLREGKTVRVDGNDLFASPERTEIPGVGRFEGYPNRDALGYIDMYGLEGVRTMFRGTLRNVGHCETWYAWVQLGLLDASPRPELSGRSCREFVADLVGPGGDLRSALAARAGIPRGAPALTKLEWLGLFEDVPLPAGASSNLDVLAGRLAERCRYAARERDMIVLQHKFVIEYDNRVESVDSTLVDFGEPTGDSAMARTVSLPVAIAARRIATGGLDVPGVHAPVHRAVYEPILDELSALGVRPEERTTSEIRAYSPR